MPFELAIRFSAIMLAAAAFAGLLFTRSLPLPLAIATVSVLLFATLQTVAWPAAKRLHTALCAAPVIWNSLLIGAFLLFLLDVTTLSRELLPAGIHFLVILLNIKLVTLHDRRDYRHLYAISLMAILASAALTTDVWYVSIFLLYLLAAVWSLLLYHLTGRIPGHPLPGGEAGRPVVSGHITSGFFWLTNGIAVLTCILTLIIFFLLPRISVGVLQKPRGEGLKTTGFSERVDLGMIGSVKEDPQIVMRVQLPDQAGAHRERLYLRGLAYDHYNGRSWSSISRPRRSLGLIADGIFAVRSSGDRGGPISSTETLRQDILLEPLDTSVLFASPFAEYVNGDFPGVHVDGMTGLQLPYASSSRLRYSVVSRERRLVPEDREAREFDYAPAVRNRYLQIHQGFERVAELARRVTDGAVTAHEKSMAVLHHLLSDYEYSLDADTTTSIQPIDDFLFSRKTGYCEHYATAMVIMLRSIGIPARLVTGFLATEWNEFGGYYTVRQRDAHAWVEVYYPHSGWITLDPTPSASALPASSVWDGFQRFSESLRLQWDRIFIRYSVRDQLAIIQSLREGGDSARDVLSQWTVIVQTAASQLTRTWAGRVHPVMMSVFVLAASVALAWWALLIRDGWPLRGPGRRGPGRKQQLIVQQYKKMLKIVARRGIDVTASSTPTDVARRVKEKWGEAESAVVTVGTLYSRGRFSLYALTGEELTHAVDQVRALQRLPRAAQ
jgi:protein-glutamine gamma-glutamyltransferase